ncbi:hypothetical protein ACWEQL_00465 [Kitasatospora sp. NPDC004240]
MIADELEVFDAELVPHDQTGANPTPTAPFRDVRPRQVRQVGLIRTGPLGDGTVDFEFLDTSRRGPERRELAIQLGVYFELTPVRRPQWTEHTVDTGHELVDGRLRATSETTEQVEMRAGYGRTDLELRGDIQQLARFAALLPDALDLVDALSARWARVYSSQLASRDEAEYLMGPKERPAAVRHWRRGFAHSFARATGQRALPVAPALPGDFLHGREDAAAATALAALGSLWLENTPSVGRPSVTAGPHPALPARRPADGG